MDDLKFAWRSLWTHVAFAAIAVLTLAIAVGGATAIFSVLNAVALRPLPYGDPGGLVIIRDAAPPRFPEFSVSPGRFVEWQKRTRVFEGIAASQNTSVNLTGQGYSERLRAAIVSPTFFSVMRITPIAGRVFSPDEDRTTPSPIVILSEALWRGRFGADPEIVGRTIAIDDLAMQVIGVIPASLTTVSPTQVWLLMALTAEERVRYGSHYLACVGRMKPGVTVDQARADLERASREIESIDGNQGWTVMVEPLHDHGIRAARSGSIR